MQYCTPIDILSNFTGGGRLVRTISPEMWVHLLTAACTVD